MREISEKYRAGIAVLGLSDRCKCGHDWINHRNYRNCETCAYEHCRCLGYEYVPDVDLRKDKAFAWDVLIAYGERTGLQGAAVFCANLWWVGNAALMKNGIPEDAVNTGDLLLLNALYAAVEQLGAEK